MSAQFELTDTQREELIDASYFRMLSAKTEPERRAALAEMAELIKGRSEAQVRAMEIAKGLR